jgi:hypothetical protein
MKKEVQLPGKAKTHKNTSLQKFLPTGAVCSYAHFTLHDDSVQDIPDKLQIIQCAF